MCVCIYICICTCLFMCVYIHKISATGLVGFMKDNPNPSVRVMELLTQAKSETKGTMPV